VTYFPGEDPEVFFGCIFISRAEQKTLLTESGSVVPSHEHPAISGLPEHIPFRIPGAISGEQHLYAP
jgi:hypothetical protein